MKKSGPVQSRMEEGLKQMESVQDDMMKKMEKHVDQLITCDHYIIIIGDVITAHHNYHYQHTPQELHYYVQLKQMPNINDSVYNS